MLHQEQDNKYHNGFLRDTKPEDIDSLFDNILFPDFLETISITPHGYEPVDFIKMFLPFGVFKSGIDNNGDVVFIYGLTPIKNKVATITFLCTDKIKKYSREFLRNARPELNKMAKEADVEVVYNYTLARNGLHLRFLKFMGATVDESVRRFGRFGLDFHYFELDFYEELKHD